MSACGLSGCPFLARDLAAIAKWSQSIARLGWTTTVEPFDPDDDDSVESLFVTLPGGFGAENKIKCHWWAPIVLARGGPTLP